MARIVEDGFYDKMVELTRFPLGHRQIRVSLVKKDSNQGVDIRILKANGAPFKGLLLQRGDAVSNLRDALNSDEVTKFLESDTYLDEFNDKGDDINE